MRSIKKSFQEILGAVAVVVSRLNVLPANVNLLGSFGFFSQSWLGFAVSIFVFDKFIGGFYRGFLWTYLGFAGYYLLGRLAAKSWRRQVLLLPTASFLFFLLSNFGVWYNWYPHTWSGLLECYLLAVPFYKNTLLGDLVFGYGYLLVKKIVDLKTWQRNLAPQLVAE